MREEYIELPVVVDYTLTVEDAISRGKYRNVSPDIESANFPICHKPVREGMNITFVCGDDVVLFPDSIGNGGCCETEYIYRRLYKVGFRPALLIELLSLGMSYSQIPVRAGPHHVNVYALGSEWRDVEGRPLVPSISGALDQEGSWLFRSLVLSYSRGSHALGDGEYSAWPMGRGSVFACVRS